MTASAVVGPGQVSASAGAVHGPVAVRVVVDGEPTVRRMAVVSRSGLRDELESTWPQARVAVHDDAGVLSAEVATPDAVVVVAGQRRVRLDTLAESAAAVLAAAGLELGPLDRVRLVRSGTSGPGVQDGDRVVVTRVRRVVSRDVEVLAAPVRRRASADLYEGQRRVVSPGRPGRRVFRVVTVRAAGEVTGRSRTLVSSRRPRPRVVLVGSTPHPVAESAGGPVASGPWPRVPGGAESRNWAALAQCEASGNPRAVNPAGYYGLYQFNVATWGTVGGTGMPHRASPAEQTYRAKLLYASRGAQPWPVCGRLL